MIHQFTKRELDPDEEYLELEDKDVTIKCNPPEDSKDPCVRCIDCKLGAPVFLRKQLVKDFDKRTIKLANNTRMKHLYRIDECEFTKEVRRCALDRTPNTYYTLNSTCEHAVMDKLKKQKEDEESEAHRVRQHIEQARKISVK